MTKPAFDFYNNLVKQWGDSLSGTPESVARTMYAEKAVLVPTVDNNIRTNFHGIADYFKEFLTHKPVMIHFENIICQIFRENEVLDVNHTLHADTVELTGYYEFQFNDGTKTQARYTFVFRDVDGKWLILNHHSSKLPHPDQVTKYH